MSLSLARKIFLAGLCFANAGAFATEMAGRVVGVLDGDTIAILTTDKQQVRVRLGGIDAPEKRQAFGSAAKATLSTFVYSRQVTVEWHKKTDRYGRVIGKVFVDGLDINLRMIRVGMAWHYKRFAKEQWAADRLLYADAETLAHARHIGLWQDADPIPPWDFRTPVRNRSGAHAAP